MKKLLLVLYLLFACCNADYNRTWKGDIFVGVVIDYEHFGNTSFMNSPKVTLRTDRGFRGTCVLYRDIVIGDSVFIRGSHIVWH